jgi:hypothetical protein
MDRIFISYRRSDTAADANALYQTLRAQFGEGAIFKDVDNVPLGTNFRSVIEKAISESSVILVLVGPEWDVTRLAAPTDNVRLELEAALGSGKTVIPVCVRGARLPSPTVLPESLAELPLLNAAALDHESWDRDCAPLIAALVEARRSPAEQPRQSSAQTADDSWSVVSPHSTTGELSMTLVQGAVQHELTLRRTKGWSGALGLATRWALLLDGSLIEEKNIYVGEQAFAFTLAGGGGTTAATLTCRVPAAGAVRVALVVGGTPAGTYRL